MKRQLTSDRVASEWARFCGSVAGELLPMTFIEQEDNLTIIGHERGIDADPITCRSGQVVRRLALSFEYDFDEVNWS